MVEKPERWVLGALTAGLLLLIALSRLTAQPQNTNIYGDLPLDDQLLRLDRRALDVAYEQQLIKLFGIWLADGARDAAPITNGLRNARRAYNIAATQIAKRELELGKNKN
jgi:hypothetical protein